MLLTIFTPTYNRADTIIRLYNSLTQQNCKDFEWLIVDDGSTDETSSIVKSFVENPPFPIRYIYKENGGKHSAYNIGLREAKGEYFYNIDSDDWITPDIVEFISQVAKQTTLRNDCAGIIALKDYENGNIIGREFKNDKIFTTLRALELSGQRGERSLIFRTSIARLFEFPTISNERFMPEGVVYDRFKDYTFFVINRSLTTCEYQQNGLSSNPKRLMVHNPGGYKLYYRNRIDMASSIRERIGYILRYNYFRSIYPGKEVSRYRGKYRFIVELMRPLNSIVSISYKQK